MKMTGVAAHHHHRRPNKKVRDQRRLSVMWLRAPLKPRGVMSGTHPKDTHARGGGRRASSRCSCVRSAPTNSKQLVNQLAPRVVITRQISSVMVKFILYRWWRTQVELRVLRKMRACDRHHSGLTVPVRIRQNGDIIHRWLGWTLNELINTEEKHG